MPFDQAKQQFETKTQKAPEKVEGNWEQFKTDTKEYFDKKQKEVRDYIDKANYQDKENDKTKYLQEMGKALDDVIDGNEATKQEMADYKKELQAKSEALKNKLETESTRSELYYGVGKGFESVGLKTDINDNVKTYLSVPWAQRLPLNYIKDFMNNIFKSQWSSSEALNALKENGDVLYTVFNYLCRGDKDQAETKSKPLVGNLKFIDSCAKLKQGNDIMTNLQVTDVMLILASLIKSGVNKEKAADFLVNNLNKLQKLDKEGFDLIMFKYPRAELPKFLLEGVIAVNEGKTINSIDGIKITLQNEAEFLKKKSEIEGKNGQLEQTMKDKEAELMQYREKNPQVMIDGETSRMEKEIAQTKLGMVNCMQEMLLAETKRDLVTACISGNMVNPSSPKMKLLLKDVQNAKKSGDLNNISLKYGLKISFKQLPVLQSIEMQAELALKEYEQKKDIEDNREIGDGRHIQNVLNLFYRTGELKGEDKEIIAKEYEKQGQNLQKIIFQFSRAAEENKKYFTEVIGNKYQSFDEVPASEKESVLVKLTGQMALLKNLYGTSAKYLGVLESRLAIIDSTAAKGLQLNDAFSKLEISAGIEDCKVRAQDFLEQYNKIGKFLGVKEEKFLSDYDKDGLNLKKMLNQYPKAAEKNKGEYESILSKYKTIKEVPYYEQEGISRKLTQSTDMLKIFYSASAKYIGILESRLALTNSRETKKGIEEEIKKYKANAEKITEEHNKIAKFLGVKDEDFLRDINLAVKAPAEIASPLMQKELAPYYSHINVHGKNIAEAAGPLEYISAIIQDQAEINERLVPYQFDRSLGMMDKMVSAMKVGRSTLLNDRIELSSMMLGLKDPEKYDKLPESMRLTRKKALESLIKQIDNLLEDANLPFSTEAISKVKDNREKLALNRDKIIKYKAWAGVVTALTFCTAIGGAVGAGFGAKALGNVIVSRLIMTPMAASLTLGTMSMAAVSGGAALGSRFGMQLTSWADVADNGGWKKIWAPKGIAKDFAYGFALSVAAVGAAKGLIAGLEGAATWKWLADKLPRLSKFSRSALSKMEGLSKFASPSTWFEGAEVAGSSEARRNFSMRFLHQSKEELAQESMEEAAGRVNKTAEFLVSVASASKGGRRLNVHGIKAKSVDISVEGENLTYTTNTAQEFVINFQKKCPGILGIDYNIKINQDKSVTIELMTGKIDPKTGVSKLYSVIDVKPGMEMGNIKADAEFARSRGLNAVEGKPNVYTVGDVEQGLDILSDFYSRGYNIVKTEGGNIKISKGNQYIELSAPAGMMAMLNLKTEAELTEAVKNRSALKFLKDNVVKIKEYLSNINIKKSFQELVVKWQGNYANFLENSPRLAKLLPADLLQIRFIPVPVIGLTCGIALDLKSAAEIAGVPMVLGTIINKSKLSPEGLKLVEVIQDGDIVKALKEGTLQKEIPEIAHIFGPESYQHTTHENPRIGDHTIEVLKNLRESKEYKELAEKDPSNKIVLEIAALLHDIGKQGYKSQEEAKPDPHHENKSADKASEILDRMNLPKDIKERVLLLIRYHSAVSGIALQEMGLKGKNPEKYTLDEVADSLYHSGNLKLLQALNYADIQSVKASYKDNFEATKPKINEIYRKIEVLLNTQISAKRIELYTQNNSEALEAHFDRMKGMSTEEKYAYISAVYKKNNIEAACLGLKVFNASFEYHKEKGSASHLDNINKYRIDEKAIAKTVEIINKIRKEKDMDLKLIRKGV